MLVPDTSFQNKGLQSFRELSQKWYIFHPYLNSTSISFLDRKWSCISNRLLCHIPILAEKNTPTPHHPSRNIHVLSILSVQGYHLSDCHFTWDSPEISFTFSKQRPDQFNLANINLKTICCFIGKTHVYETAWSLTFFIIRSSLPVGEAEILHASEAGWICYSTQGNYCSSRKRAYLYWTGEKQTLRPFIC